MSLTQKALHAFKWSVLGEVASRAIGPLVFLVMARLLVPADFGVVAAATVIISFSQVFSDAGLAKALIQRQDRTADSANVVFWINLGIGVLVVAILQLAAPLIASFFHDQRIAPVVRVLSLQILLAAFSSVHTALLQKGLSFKQLFWVRLVTTGAPGLASIPLAMNGVGYWALVAGGLFGQVVQSIVLWNRSPWRPHWGLDRMLAKELVAFGKWAMLSGLLGWFYGWMDAIVVGHYLGPHDMGLYRTGNTFVTMIFGIIFSPLLPVLYSLFSRVQEDLPRIKNVALTVMHASALLSLPIGFGIFLVKDELALVIFGDNWVGVGLVIGFLAITHSVGWLVGSSGEVFRAVGKPYLETLVMVSTIALYFIGYIIAIQHGLLAFLAARLLLVCISILPHMVLLNKTIGLTFRGFISVARVPLLAVLTGYAILAGGWVIIGEVKYGDYLILVFFALSYAVAVMLFDRRFIGRIIALRKVS
ncbi:MAG: lipopolysaccharide biosynthesis protein [Candidatus Accumulibacter sp.]|uniref:lipopolysaccharide biosynthesis protein n=1 Tax=Accumulibacter sp. TaxID=2053492 RepID=UPI0025891E51|nr:lipopolysaccharide biosynthesis protein [Accumulibacter sp.]MBK8116968.1 lipopolysaccharide biosynthesis protein [Accumulibacter sp.]